MKRVRNSFSSEPNRFECVRGWHALHEIIMHRMMNGYLVKTLESTTMYYNPTNQRFRDTNVYRVHCTL